MKYLKLYLFFCCLITSVNAQTVNIAVAANVSYAMKDIIKEFSILHPEAKLETILGSSGKLTAQIKNNAPFDVFLSANMLYPITLYKDGFALLAPKVYAQGALAVLSKKPRQIINIKNLLKEKSVRRIAIANPKTAPYGKASFETLKNLDLSDAVKSKIIYTESIAQTLSYTLKVADIGFIAKSALYSKKLQRFKKDIHWFSIDEKLYEPINQGIVILKHAKNNPTAQQFYEFVMSKQAQKIFKDFGYTIPCTN